jgi:hypothetical protein
VDGRLSYCCSKIIALATLLKGRLKLQPGRAAAAHFLIREKTSPTGVLVNNVNNVCMHTHTRRVSLCHKARVHSATSGL